MLGLTIAVVAYLLGGYIPVAIATYRLMLVSDYDRKWRSVVPLWNLLLLFDLAGVSRWYVLVLLVPLVNLIVMPTIAGEIARRGGKPAWIGWVAGVPGIYIVGLPALAMATSDVPDRDPAARPLEELRSRAKTMLQGGADTSYVITYLQSNGVAKRAAAELVDELSIGT